mgnify:CR=1 FL=1
MEMIVVQLILFCCLFTVLVKLSVLGGAVNGLFFYPKTYQECAFELGIASREETERRRKRFMPAFFLVMTAALVLIIGLWNNVSDFRTAYLQALLFLEVMNWYDGLAIDKLWVGCSKFWVIPGLEDIPYAQTWRQMLKKRLLLSLIWVVGTALAAGIVVLFF